MFFSPPSVLLRSYSPIKTLRPGHHRAQRGLTAIELALALPVLALFIVGAVDISRSMKAYAALQEGVRTALRCSYTTDGDCVDVTPPTYQAFYRWFEVTGTQQPVADYYNYAADVNWLGQPREQASEAWVLNSVNYSIPNPSYVFRQERVPAVQPLRVVAQKAAAPHLDVGEILNSQGANARLGEMTYAATGGTGWPGSATVTRKYSGSSYRLTDSNDTINFTITGIPRPRVSIDPGAATPVMDVSESTLCRKIVQFGHVRPSSGSAELYSVTANNAASLAGCDTEREVVVHVRGSAGGSGSATTELRLGNSGQGGQEFNGAGPASFYPRGLPSGHIHPSEFGQQQGEFGHSRPRVTYPQGSATGSMDVQLKLTEIVGNPSWQLSEIIIYLPDFEIVPLSISCTSGVTTAAIESGNQGAIRESCVLPTPFESAHRLDLVPPALPNPVTVSCSPSESAALSTLNPQLGYVRINTIYENSCPKIHTSSATCAQPNPGVQEVGTPLAGSLHVRRISGANAEAQNLCPPPANVAATVNSYSETLAPMVGGAAYDLRQTSCSEPIVRPAALQNYRKPVIVSSRVDFVGHGPNVDPHQDPDYSCAAFSKRRAVLSAHPVLPPANQIEVHAPSLPAGSIFAAAHRELAPECRAGVIRSAALAALSNFPNRPEVNDAELFIRAHNPGFDHTEREPGTCAEMGAAVAGSCGAIRCTQVAGGDRTELTTTPVAGGTPPARCFEPGVVCVSELDRLEGHAGTSGTNAQRAEAQAYGLIQTLYPQAAAACAGSNCVNVSMVEAGNAVHASASMEVPLALLLGQKISLGFTEQRELEHQFAR